MSIPFPSVGSTIFSTFPVDTLAHAMDGVNGALVAAGWTSTPVAATASITVSVPSNNSTVTIAGVVYTFQTALNNAVARNILIAANATLQAQYITDAVNHGSGGGTEWSSPTVANPNVTAVQAGTSITFTSTATGSGGSFSVAGNWSTSSVGSGYICQCAATPQGLQANVYLVDSAENILMLWFGSADGSLQSATLTGVANDVPELYYASIQVQAGRTLTILANAHQFFTWLPGDKATAGCQVGMCVPYLRAGQTGVAVQSVTAGPGGTIQIQTTTAHGLTTGMNASIFGVLGVPANGPGTVTVIDSTHFYLNGTTFSGSYTSGGLVGGSGGAGNAGGISRCFFAWGDWLEAPGVGYQATWRNQTGAAAGFVCVNEYAYGFSGVGNNQISLMYTQASKEGSHANIPYYMWGGLANSQEAMVGWNGTSVNAAFRGIGLIWGALIAVDSVPMDTTNVGYLGHNWINQTDFEGVASLWLATT